ncbi:hypothetical protein HSX37_16050|uniref:Uncharacterized protein n=1 Tax=Dendrosporobacter quercicolus TaxID=146817 RepID=A0A1G9ZLQ3_9FIRM|nr:hypothetical protein [Dendrosporobacter quercicolus]NSL49548.1 hypothetical protein [Dendrosporobacter quercicolus DSM 1736]SDN22170.1 hypothetical protein SAMN04488502_1153 [Dendrosporobacter quercicolus]
MPNQPNLERKRIALRFDSEKDYNRLVAVVDALNRKNSGTKNTAQSVMLKAVMDKVKECERELGIIPPSL